MLDLDPGSRSYGVARGAARGLHTLLARQPRAAELWLSALAMMRHLPDGTLKLRVANSVASVVWPELSLPPQRVVLGDQTEVWLRPHPGEADFGALLSRRLVYEPEVFRWLEAELLAYEAVIEIGANVGLFTVFMGERARRAGRSTPRFFAFEPSRTAYARLLDNLALNDLDAQVFNCAVGSERGLAAFHEPRGHLTNGSLVREFAGLFASEVRSSQVEVVAADEIGALVARGARTLVKIDVEGAETQVLAGLRPWLCEQKPDVILEVLPSLQDELRERDFFAALGYRFFRLEPDGPVPVAPYEAHPSHRDHLLRAP